MTGRTHDLAAFTALTAVIIAHPPMPVTLATAVAAVIANQIGGIAPDIDQPTAPLWRNLPIGGLFGKVFGKLIGGHRFITHSIAGVALLGFLVHLLLQCLHPLMPRVEVGYVWWAFMIGAASHLIMDSFTKEGVPWLLPIPVRLGVPPLRKLRITTGKWVEIGAVFPGLLLITIWLFTHYSATFFALIQQRIR